MLERKTPNLNSQGWIKLFLAWYDAVNLALLHELIPKHELSAWVL